MASGHLYDRGAKPHVGAENAYLGGLVYMTCSPRPSPGRICYFHVGADFTPHDAPRNAPHDTPHDARRTMTNGASKLAAASGKVEHGPLSYRRVLSDEGFADIVIEVFANPDKGKAGHQPDVCVKVYSMAYYKRTGKKASLKLYTPEMTMRWSDVHTIGSDYNDESKDLRQRKTGIILQTKFVEDYDQKINDRVARRAEHLRLYEDINAEVRWFYERMEKLRLMICRAIWDHKDTMGKDRSKIFIDARTSVATKRGVQGHDVKFDDPEVAERAFELFMQNVYISKAIGPDKRTSEPDSCPTGDDCMGVVCTHPEHVRGKQEYCLKASRRVFSQRTYDKDKHAACPGLMSKIAEADWAKENPDAAISLGPEELARARDAYVCERMDALGYVFTPIFYRTQKTANMSTKDALRLLSSQQGVHRAMHDRVIKFGNIVRLGIKIDGQAFPTKSGMGMTITLDSNDVTIVAQPLVSSEFAGADEIMTWGDDDDQVDLSGAPRAYVPSVDILGDLDEDIDVSGGVGKRKAEDAGESSKRARCSPDTDEQPDDPVY